jgi:hypothetical protein
VGEAARGEQLIVNQGQEWMGIKHHEQEKLVLYVSEKRVSKCKKNGIIGRGKQREGLTQSCILECLLCVSLYVICE